MIRHPEQVMTAVGVEENDDRNCSRCVSTRDGRVSLAQIWEHATRTRSLPDGLDLNKFFMVIHERLRNPEWEVRQHALRVLRDLIPILDSHTTEQDMAGVLEDLIINLGHIGPGIRKAATDCLRTYLRFSKEYNNILRHLVGRLLENSHANKVNSNVVLGVVLAIPFLMLPKIQDEIASYVINQLMIKSTIPAYQEIALRSLVRIKYILGDNKFNEIFCLQNTVEDRKNFEALCYSYNLHYKQDEAGENKGVRNLWNDSNQNIVEEIHSGRIFNTEVRQQKDNDIELELVEDKVILETEIQLRSGSSLTMQVHEESRQNSFNEATDSEEDSRRTAGLVKILTDESEYESYDPVKRTPRRVRFGGEVVKLRTPDSDSNATNDEGDSSSNKKVRRSSVANIPSSPSRIPVFMRRKKSSSAPSSPKRFNNISKTSVHYSSSPNLSDKLFGPRVTGHSRIPRRRGSFQSTIKITINEIVDFNKKDKHEESIKNSKANERKGRSPIRNKAIRKVQQQIEDGGSPIPKHKEVEMLYNLTRSPDRQKLEDQATELQNKNVESNDNSVTKTAELSLIARNGTNSSIKSMDQAAFRETYSSFKICSPERYNKATQMTKDILIDLHCKENAKTRLRGLENLMKLLKSKANATALVEGHLSDLLPILFNLQLQPIMKLPAQEILERLIIKTKESVLHNNLHQLAIHLSRMGAPDGVRLGHLLLKRLPPSALVDKLLTKAILQAKSSKTREGSLQMLIMICRMSPSTDIDVCKITKAVVPIAFDKKRRIRQAVLEVMATLAQTGSASTVMDVASSATLEHPDRQRLLEAIRTRLSRKQLPSVDPNGRVRYSTPIGEAELQWLSPGSASGTALTTTANRSDRVQSSTARIDSFNEVDDLQRKENYWQRNSHHREFGSASAVETYGRASERSRSPMHLTEDASSNQTSTQIWAIDSSTFPSNPKQTNGTLRPIFVLQPNRSDAPNTNTTPGYSLIPARLETLPKPRRRSFSPPKKKAADSSFDSGDSSDRNAGENSRVRRSFRRDSFRKSFSSDNISGTGKVLLQPGSLSSGCSSTSTSASGRGGTWHGELKSGIPVPVGSSSKIKFRRRHLHNSRGPVSIDTYTRSKLPSPINSPEKEKAFLRAEPLTSGSESSGYFTPPAEHHLPEVGFDYQNNNRAERTPERFIRMPTPKREPHSFVMVENEHLQQSCNNEGLEKKEEKLVDKSESSFVIQDNSSSEEKEETENADFCDSLDDLDCAETRPYKETLSKSVGDLKGTSAEVPRKSLKSAPPLHDASLSSVPVYHTFNETTINITNAALPGSVDVVVQSELKTVEVDTEKTEKEPEKKPFKRTMSKTFPRRALKTYQVDTCSLPDTVQPLAKPKDALIETLTQLESNDWETTMKGLKALIRLKKHHSEVLEPHMHNVCVALGRHIKNLRSQVARAACTAASEMFAEHKKTLEMEVEELAAPLLQRTADTNKFLRSDANAALDTMCVALPPPKVIAVITSRGCAHQNAIVRATSARLLSNLVHRLGADKIFQLPRETRDKILLAGANMLMDGNLDARKNAKMMLSNLCSHAQFHKAILEAIPACTMRHIQKTLKSLK